ncbi:MAG: PAS domain S-box protein [Desulfurivibrionaceae bacterium]|nr:PAS domain S-box protein [Desulfurivibrionaceae bacterium]
MESKLIIENASEAIISVEQNGEISAWNKAAESVFGWKAGEVLGKPLDEFIVLNNGNGGSFFSQLEQQEAPKDTVVTFTHPAGRVVPFEFNVSKISSGANSIYAVFARDVSSRWQRERELFDAYQKQGIINSILNVSFRKVSFDEQMELILDLILSIPTIKLLPSGAILLAGDEPGVLYLKSQRGFSGQQIESCRQVPFGKCHCGRAAREGEIQFVECVDESHDFIFEQMKPHGHYCVPILTNYKVQGVIALYIEEGHRVSSLEIDTLKAIANVVGGIIERKKMEDQLSDLVEGLRSTINDLDYEKNFNESVISNLASGLLILDNSGRIEKSNPAARQFIGAIYDGSIDDKYLAEIFGESAAALLTTPRASIEFGRDELFLEQDGGGQKVFEYIAMPREDGLGREQGLILNFSDVTAHKRIQAELEKMNRFSTIAEIASAVAHEIRNPLAGIMTMAQIIEEQLPENDSKKEYIGRIIRQVDRLNVLLTDFFTYARPPRPKKEKVALVSIIDEIRPFMQNKMQKCGITFAEKYGDRLPDIMVDSNQIQQVFLNLMLNSMDAIKQDGAILLNAEYISKNSEDFDYEKSLWLDRKCNYVVVTFEDSGGGMSPETLERVFEPFFTTKHNGTGLGMAIVFRILKENNAGIKVESNNGAGTTFTLFFMVD